MHRIRQIRIFLVAAIAPLLLVSVLAADQISWVKEFDVARKQAAKEKKFVVLDISASW
jgi:hypothetical protein